MMPSGGLAELPSLLLLQWLYTRPPPRHPTSLDGVNGAQWTPWDSESVSCRTMMGQQTPWVGLSGPTGDRRGPWQWHPRLRPPGHPESSPRPGGFSGPVGVSTGQPRPGNSANRGASHRWAAGTALALASRGKASVGSKQWGGKRGLGLQTSPHPHFVSSSWSFSDDGDCPDTAEAGGVVTGSNQIPGSAGYQASHPTSLGLFLPICEMGMMIAPTTQQ